MRFLARRLLAAILIMLGVIFLVMATMDVIPGDPAAMMLGQGATEDMVKRLRAELNLDRPILVRYGQYLGRLARGNLGRSIVDERPVSEEIRGAWIATLQLGGAALLLTIVFGVLIGVFSARWHRSLFDGASRVISLLGLSMPVFWTGIVFILVFSLWLRWLPSGGRGGWIHLLLPAVTLAIPSVATIARVTRSAMLGVLHEDYVRTAYAKGVKSRAVLFRHALRNALIPVVTVLGLQMGQLLGGAILTETVFSWPGVGRLLVQAISSRDYILLEGGVLLLAATFVVTNLAVDVVYAYLDPRIAYR
ncbi:MAG TPA: ABC transporter permease [bacterium]|nr:ABC transporter permease [bacterium]